MSASNSGILTLGGTWSNTGTISESRATVNLGGLFTPAGLGTFNRSGGTVNLTGTLDSTGTTLALKTRHGLSGTFRAARSKGSGAATPPLGAQEQRSSTPPAWHLGRRDGEQLSRPLQGSGTNVTIVDGLMLNGVAYWAPAVPASTTTPDFTSPPRRPSAAAAASSLAAATAAVTTESTSPMRDNSYHWSGHHDPRGQRHDSRWYSNNVLVNQGTIAADTSGGTIGVNVSTLMNQGTMSAASGTLAIRLLAGRRQLG